MDVKWRWSEVFEKETYDSTVFRLAGLLRKFPDMSVLCKYKSVNHRIVYCHFRRFGLHETVCGGIRHWSIVRLQYVKALQWKTKVILDVFVDVSWGASCEVLTDGLEEVIIKTWLKANQGDEVSWQTMMFVKKLDTWLFMALLTSCSDSGYLGLGNCKWNRIFDPEEGCIWRYFVNVIVITLIWSLIPLGIVWWSHGSRVTTVVHVKSHLITYSLAEWLLRVSFCGINIIIFWRLWRSWKVANHLLYSPLFPVSSSFSFKDILIYISLFLPRRRHGGIHCITASGV